MKKVFFLFLLVVAAAFGLAQDYRVEDADVVVHDRAALVAGTVVELQLETNGWLAPGNCNWLQDHTVLAATADLIEAAGLRVGPRTEQLLRENARRRDLESAEFVRRDSSRIQRGTMDVPPVICIVSTGGDGQKSGVGIGGSYRGNDAAVITTTATSSAFLSLDFYASDMEPIGRLRGVGNHKSNNIQGGAIGIFGGFFSRLLGVRVFEAGYISSSDPLERAARFSTANALKDAGEKLKRIVSRGR
ncbi:hypothetical protein HY844_02265 [Candidatus Berkelbacteria bacterium]|nr:hypothetical protein [Candidatus Berkelbacteria bacterium]